jgi:predicted site-specific integrase-resolvase
MTLHFEKISQNNRYGYGRVSSKEQANNSSLDAQKDELTKLGVPEENIYLEIGSAIDGNFVTEKVLNEQKAVSTNIQDNTNNNNGLQ